MCSNEVLAERYRQMEKQNKQEHNALGDAIVKVDGKLDKLMDKLNDTYVMRREFKVGMVMLIAFSTILGIIQFFIK